MFILLRQRRCLIQTTKKMCYLLLFAKSIIILSTLFSNCIHCAPVYTCYKCQKTNAHTIKKISLLKRQEYRYAISQWTHCENRVRRIIVVSVNDNKWRVRIGTLETSLRTSIDEWELEVLALEIPVLLLNLLIM